MDEKELENLYKAVSSKFDVGDYKTFTSKMGTPEQRKKFYDVVGKQGFDLGDYGEYEKRLGKPNGVSSQGLKNTSQTSTKPLQPSQQANPFGNTQPTAPTIDVATGKTGVTKIQAMNDRIAKVEKKGTDVKNTLGASLNSLYEGVLKTPRFVYDLFSAPQNFISEQFNIPEIATNYDNFLRLTDRASAGAGSIVSPLTILDSLGDSYANDAKSYQDRQIKYDKGIVESLGDGDFSNAGSQLVNQIVGSLPSVALMAMTSGAGSATKLGTLSKTAVNALPFASSKSNEIRDNKEIPDWMKPIYSGLNGLTEVIFDQKFGTQAIINKLIDKFKNEGREVAVEEGKKFITGYLTKAFKGIKEPISDLAKNAIEEGATQLSQNIIDKATINPDKDLWEGVPDAMVVGGAMGGGISGVGALVNVKSRAKIAEKTKAIEELTKDLDTDIPEATKETILSEVGKLKRELNTEISKADLQFEALEEMDKEKAIELSAKIEGIDKSLAQEGISPTTKTVLTEQKTALEEQLAEIKPVEPVKVESEVIAPVVEVKVTEDAKITPNGGAVEGVTEGAKVPEYFNVYEEAVKQSPTKEEAFAKVTENGAVLSDTFNKKYNPDGTLTPEETFNKFYNEVKQKEETQNAVKEREVQQNSVSQRVGTIESQQGQQENRQYQESNVSQGKTETSSSNRPEKSGEVVKPVFTIKGETVTPKVDVANPVVPLETEELAQKKRASVQRVLKSPDYSQEFKDSLTDKTILYTELPNKITDKEAQAMIDVAGEAEMLKSLYDFNNGISSAVRFSVMQKMIDNYEEAGEYEKAGELAQELYSRGTDYGQGVQIFATFPKLNSASQLAIAEKTVKAKRDVAKKASKKTTDKIVKDFKDINKQSAEEAVANVTKTVDKVLNENTPVEPLPVKYGSANKIVTKDKYQQALKNLRKKSFSVVGGVPLDDLAVIAGFHLEASGRDFANFSKRMISDVGSKIKPYLKELYAEQRDLVKEGDYLTDKELDAVLAEQDGTKWKEQLDKSIKKSDKKALKEQEKAITKLQDISKGEGLWGQYKESAVARLKGLVKTNVQSEIQGRPSLQQFTDDLVRNMRAKMTELLPEQPSRKSTPRPDIEIIADAYKNFEKYQDVWNDTQMAFIEKYADQPEVLESIDQYFGEILDRPFNEKSLGKAVMSGLKDMGKNINEIIVQHYTVADALKQDLADKLVEQAGLTGRQATELSIAVQEQFDKIATKKKQQALDRIFSKKLRRKPEVRTLGEDIIRLSNLGAFTSNEISEAYADKMGFPKLTEQQKQEIIRLSNIVQNTKDSIAKRRATEDLLGYQAKIKGWSWKDDATAIWYANVLSGYNTQVVNFGANAVNTASLYTVLALQKPKSALWLARGLAGGLKRGLLEARETLRTGYSPIKGAPEIPTQLELRDFMGKMVNPLNWLKYVRRIMIAADVIFFEGQKEMRAYQLAKQQASNEGKVDPTMDMVNRQLEILGRNNLQRQSIEERVELEYEQQVAEIESANLSAKDKKQALKIAEKDKARKTYDYIEQERPTDIIEASAKFGATGTYNYQPQGVLGIVAKTINDLAARLPALRYVVPFTNIIANVANESINYTPLGYVRRLRADSGGGLLSQFRREPLTDNEKADLTTKATLSTVLLATTFLLTQPLGEDDEPFLEVTANGTGDFSKNEALAKTGWQPYSFRYKLPSGKYSSWISYQYSPFINNLGYIGHLNDSIKYKAETDEDTLGAKLQGALGLVSFTFFSNTYLKGMGEFLQGLLDPRSSEKLMDKVIKGGLGVVKGLVVPNMYSQVAQGYNRIFDTPKKEVRENYFGALLQDIPYARNMFYDKINLFGEPIMYDTDKFISSGKADKLVQLLVDKKAVYAPPSRKIEKTYDMETGRERMLTDEEFYLFVRTRGQAIKRDLEARYEELSKLTNEGFKKEITKIKKEATKLARAKVANGENTLFEIEDRQGGKTTTYKLTPAQALEREKAVEKYIATDGKNDLEAYTRDYVNLDKLDKKTATEKAKLDVRKDALKVTTAEILDKLDKGEIKLEIKE